MPASETPAKQEGFAVADGAGGVQEESSLAGQDERVDDAQHGVDGVGISGLANPASAGSRLPLGVKVSALETPSASTLGHSDRNIWIGDAGRSKVDVEFNLWLLR